MGFLWLAGVVVNNGIVFVVTLTAAACRYGKTGGTSGDRKNPYAPDPDDHVDNGTGNVYHGIQYRCRSRDESRMAIVVIGGLLYATLMTLIRSTGTL